MLTSSRRSALTADLLEIDRVYVGPGGLKEKTFRADLSYSKLIGLGMIHYVKVPVPNGQPGIWWVNEEKERLVSVFDEVMPWFYMDDLPRTENGLQVLWGMGGPIGVPNERMIFAPAWRGGGAKIGDARYEIAVACAEVFEKISQAGDKERLKVIDDYVRSHDSVKGAAALMALARGNTPIMISKDTRLPLHERYRVEKFPKIGDYVLPFSKDEALPPRVQWEVERLLLFNKDGWKGSPEERQMIKRWYTGAWREKDKVTWETSEEKALVDHLRLQPPFTFPGNNRLNTTAEKLQLAVVGLANEARSDKFKAELLRYFRGGLLPQDPADAEKGFAYLVETIRKGTPPSERTAAAKLLVAFIPFSAQQRQTIESLRKQKLGDAVTKEMEKALAEK